MNAGGEALDPRRCPLCGVQNRCAMELERETGEAQPPCWCMAADFSRAPLAALPPALRGKACLCARCAAGANPEARPQASAGAEAAPQD